MKKLAFDQNPNKNLYRPKSIMHLTSWLDSRSEVRIAVSSWALTEPILNQYIEHPRSFWTIWNYLKKIGFKSVIHKLRSRLLEVSRNNKMYGIGIGIVEQTFDEVFLPKGAKVIFFSPNHNPISKMLCLNKAFVVPIKKLASISDLGESQPFSTKTLPPDLLKYIGWSRYSGVKVDVDLVSKTLLKVSHFFSKSIFDYHSEDSKKNIFSEQINAEIPSAGKPTAVLFGLGNYAKTIIIPNICHDISLQRVHEIDPDQLIFFEKKSNISLDTCPYPRSSQRFDSWFIAGFHHMHTELAVLAFQQSAYAVIEKPLSTTWSQYLNFIQALDEIPDARFFLCFHKRYSELHKYAMEDFGVLAGSPIDMHCVVYEIPLPALHWYNWPNSGSRLISNGCHWIDYFLFVNNYCDVIDYRKWQPRGADVVVQIKLSNGAYFSMTLTDAGSQRLGVRDYIELRCGGVTINMVDGALYSAENRRRIFRKIKVNPLNAYRYMYKEIGSEIAKGGKGNGRKSLLSSEITLKLEELI